MQTSESIKNIAAALVSFHKEVGRIPKDAKNPFFKSRYASLSGILDAINEPLINNGLSIVQFPERENELTTRILHASGEWMEATYYIKSTKDTPQDKGSALTYQRRYAIGAVLSLNIDEDDDGNAASGKATTPLTAKKETKPAISDAAFAKALARIENGEKDLADKLKANYALTDLHIEVLNEKTVLP